MRWTIIAGLLIAFTLRAQDNCDGRSSPRTEIGNWISTQETFRNDRREISVRASQAAQIRYMRLRITVPGPTNCDWLLTVRNTKGHVVQTFTAADFSADSSVWTVRIYPPPDVQRPSVRVTLDGCPGDTPAIQVVEHIEMPESTLTPLYSAADPTAPRWENLLNSNDVSSIRLGDAVGLLVTSWNGVPPWSCSGVMVASDLFLTNWHCGGQRTFQSDGFWNDLILRDSIVDLSWDGDSLSREFTVVAKVADSPTLDYAVLRVRPLNALGRPHVARLSFAPPQSPLRTIHHPEALIKQLTRNCTVLNSSYRNWKRPELTTEFTHDCDTEGGSSGAPIFNATGEVVGLQHLGFECPPAEKVNKGVRMDAILDDLRCRFSAVATAILPRSTLDARQMSHPCN